MSPARLTLHPVFLLISVGLTLVTIFSTSIVLSFSGLVMLALVLIIWVLYDRRGRD